MSHDEPGDPRSGTQRPPRADGRGNTSTTTLPLIPMRDSVTFPHAMNPFTVGRARSRRAIESLSEPPGESGASRGADATETESDDDTEHVVALVTQRDPASEEPDAADLYTVGTAARVLQVLPRSREHFIVITEGLHRLRVVELVRRDPYLEARVERLEDSLPEHEDQEFVALKDGVRNVFSEVVRMSPNLSGDLLQMLERMDDPSLLADFVASVLPSLDTPRRQELLELLDVRLRMKRLTAELLKERENLRLQMKIQSEVEARLGGAQREFYLREQLKAIRRELGESEEPGQEIVELKSQIEVAGLPEEPRREALRELARLEQMTPAAAEYSVLRTYLDWLVTLPWSKTSAARADVRHAQGILDEDHYDLEKVKERILEYLAVLQLQPAQKGAILCFVGPPGVGKTSLGRSIARALDRRFVHISLGGMHDEGEIRGHRRTYVGALPGQILQGLRRAGTRDPVFVLDEVDKLGRDFRGDPASALLEVLDPEQNFAFRDHYLDLDFDLSKVLFITTANLVDTIPPPLLDRMETIELPGYTEEEKLHIARRYLVPKRIRESGLDESLIRFTDEAIREVMRGYTLEAGVRNLERELGALCRKHARQVAAGGERPLTVTPEVVRERLGAPRFHIETELDERCREPGVAVGLAWTPHGGEVLFVEATRLQRGRGEFVVTGQLGPVMQESTRAALSWLRAHASDYGIDPADFRRYDLHLHVPSGGVPKDGPSAGVVMVAALLSLLRGWTLRPRLAMTGEITLSGTVLPVGGIKEKVLAARRAGVRELVLPERNRPNLEDVPAELREGMRFHFVRKLEEALAWAFGAERAPEPKNQPLSPLTEEEPAPLH